MANAGSIAIATHPQHMLLAGRVAILLSLARRRRDLAEAGRLPSGGTDLMFANSDSTRLYFASPQGLFFSSDAGDTWERAAGAFGQIQTTALGYADRGRPHDPLCGDQRRQAATSRRRGRCGTPGSSRHSDHDQAGGRRRLPLRRGDAKG